MNSPQQKFLFVYLRTGGGHLAPAKSVANYISKKNENAEVILFDGLEKSWWFARFVVVDGYRILQNKAKWIYELIYFFNKIKLIANISAFLVTINTQKYFEQKILDERPDKIVIFHFLLIAPIYNILKKHKLNTKIITVVTDPYTAHPLWFLRKDQTFILFSERLKTKCIRDGINTKNLNVFPFILDDKFSSKANEVKVEELKIQLGFHKEKILLILGGGDGIPKGIRILKSLLSKKTNYEIAFVCGNNKRMMQKAELIKDRYNVDDLHIYGYVDFVYNLLQISDAVVTKCGASTFMEILHSGKVPVVNSYIWEQEKGNVEFLVDNDLGIYEKNVNKLPAIINKLFGDEKYLNGFKTNIQKANLEIGTARVAEFIINF